MSEYNFELVIDLAVTTAKLKAIEVDADVLSDLGDIKELKSLGDDLEVALSQYHEKGLIPDDSLEYVRKALITWIGSAIQVLKSKEALPDHRNYFEQNLLNLEESLGTVVEWLDNISSRFEQLKKSCPVQLLKVDNVQQKLDELSLYTVLFLPEEQKFMEDVYRLIAFIVGSAASDSSYIAVFSSDVEEKKEELLFHIEAQKEQISAVNRAGKDSKMGDFRATEEVLNTPLDSWYSSSRIGSLAAINDRRHQLLDGIKEATDSSDALKKVDLAIKELGVDPWPDSSELKRYLLAEREKHQSKVRKGRIVGAVVIFLVILFLGLAGISFN